MHKTNQYDRSLCEYLALILCWHCVMYTAKCVLALCYILWGYMYSQLYTTCSNCRDKCMKADKCLHRSNMCHAIKNISSGHKRTAKILISVYVGRSWYSVSSFNSMILIMFRVCVRVLWYTNRRQSVGTFSSDRCLRDKHNYAQLTIFHEVMYRQPSLYRHSIQRQNSL